MRERRVATSGEQLSIACGLAWVEDLVEEALAGATGSSAATPTVSVQVESSRNAFDVAGWEPLTRGAWARGGDVVIEDVCSSGFDLGLRGDIDRMEFVLRWRPRLRGHVAARLLRTRFILLARAVLLQYPVLWRATIRGRAPLHAVVCTSGRATPMLAGPGGVGKSTLLNLELAAGGRAISDNICVSDGATAWGLVEPLRVEGGSGRTVTHGRREGRIQRRVDSLKPDLLVALHRDSSEEATIRTCDGATAARSLITGTYMAGELRRFWGFAATLAAGTGLGPAHPPVESIATAIASHLPALEIVLPRHPGVRLADLLNRAEVTA
jgi:hypothetical protein